MMIINPGTEANLAATLANAETIAKEIIRDLRIREDVKRDPAADADGWFRFIFINDGKSVEVDIPGDDPETVMAGRSFVSRRLYVDGSSWLYGLALGFIEEYLGGPTP